MLELFTNPDGFFERKIKGNPEFKTPFMIMGVVWLVGVCKIALILSVFKKEFPDDMLYVLLVPVAIGIIIGLIGIFFMWFMCAGIFYVLSAVFYGNGSFKRVLEFVSYGFIPYIIDTAVSSIYVWIIFSRIDMLAMIELMAENDSPGIFVNELLFSNLSITVVLTIFSIIMFCLSAYILIYGMKHARNISLKGAVFTVCIPLALYAIYELFMLLFLLIGL